MLTSNCDVVCTDSGNYACRYDVISTVHTCMSDFYTQMLHHTSACAMHLMSGRGEEITRFYNIVKLGVDDSCYYAWPHPVTVNCRFLAFYLLVNPLAPLTCNFLENLKSIPLKALYLFFFLQTPDSEKRISTYHKEHRFSMLLNTFTPKSDKHKIDACEMHVTNAEGYNGKSRMVLHIPCPYVDKSPCVYIYYFWFCFLCCEVFSGNYERMELKKNCNCVCGGVWASVFYCLSSNQA